MLKQLCITISAILLAASIPTGAQDLEPSAPPAAAASGDNGSAAAVEDLYDKEESKMEKKQSKPETTSKSVPAQPRNLSDLANLAPFSDVAVIQRRFLPKTKRFELSGTGFTNLNNPFFNSLGVTARAAYYLREQYAVEVLGAFASTSAREVTNDLQANRNITTSNVVTSKGFGALALKWNPIYGKMTWLNRMIVPFDLNFNIGGGVTQTTDGQNAPTLHMGTSQVFALTKSIAIRWDLIWNIYQANGTDQSGVTTKITQNDLLLGVGMSFYFPEATYR